MNSDVYNDIIRISQDLRQDEPDPSIKTKINTVQRGLISLMSDNRSFIEELFKEETRLKIEWLVYSWYKDDLPGSDMEAVDAAKTLKEIIKQLSKPTQSA